MLPFILRRFLTAIPTLLIVTLMVFAIQRMLPGDPALILAGEQQDPEVIAFIRAKYRLDDPVPVQYFAWLGQVARGDLGRSIRTNQPVTELIFEKLPVTAELALLSLIVALVIAIPIGVISAVRKDTPLDYAGTVFALSGLSIPNFWLGIMLILLVSVQWNLLPASGYVEFAKGPGGEPRAHDYARIRARHGARGGADAADAEFDAGGAEARLCAHRAGQGLDAAHRRVAPRAA